MEPTFWSLVAILVVSQARAQQPTPLASPIGTKYSQSTDVSHISFNSPLVTYGDSLSAIQLPAAPVRPANLREASQDTTKQEGQTLVRMFGGQEEQNQPQLSSGQPQFISIQQFPANPQLQQNDPDLSARAQPVSENSNVANQQQQYVQSPQQYISSQQPFASQQPSLHNQQQVFASPQQYVQQQQFAAQQPYINQQSFVNPQQRYAPQQFTVPQVQQQFSSPQVAYQTPQSNGYFASGPYASQPQLQYPQQQPIISRPQAAAVAQPQFVSRVAFSGPVTGFSYGF
ncbi:uncharacterized protein LOC126737462 [Anthonomus grandis grandis]|uniref:uncharacterized protein LOC126737462 n=1 Tax=Anthonomus grandis grandis TaxID=2921223 RepID=UPI002165131C|nr:uncharacterized protein LOC126737462 [Anthonomus grandis grandis]